MATVLTRDQLLADLGRALREHYGAEKGDGLLARLEPWIGLPWPFPEREPPAVPSPRAAMLMVGDAIRKHMPDRAWLIAETLSRMSPALALAEAIAVAVRPDGGSMPARMSPPHQQDRGRLRESGAEDRRRIVVTAIRHRGRDLDLLDVKLRPATLAGGRILLTRLLPDPPHLIPDIAYWIAIDGDVLTSWVHPQQIAFGAAVQGPINAWCEDAPHLWKTPAWQAPWVLP